jgi:lipoate-protein ligase A
VRNGSAGELHGLEPQATGRAVWIMRLTRPALVLGSTQTPALADDAALAARGMHAVRRRSGGGAVLLDPVRSVWIDVVIGRDDPLWDDDVHRSFAWLGAVWVDTLSGLGVRGRVGTADRPPKPESRLVCFAGLGAGEVVDDVGAKVVGLSQRRVRSGARYQCLVSLTPVRAGEIVDLLREPVDPAERRALAERLDAGVAGVDATADAVVEAFLAALGSRTA